VRLLIYGFGPYRQFRENITEKILRNFPKRSGVKKIIFPVRFNKRQFLEALRKYRPDTVLGLGQCSAGQRLRIERRAVNRRRGSDRHKPRRIIQGGSYWLATSLRLEKSPQARFSKLAGDYVCNYSMYVILDYIQRHQLPMRFGFIHVPHQYNLDAAKSFLMQVTKRICK
jgi:pyroglutamyl-peptidase